MKKHKLVELATLEMQVQNHPVLGTKLIKKLHRKLMIEQVGDLINEIYSNIHRGDW